MKKAWMLHKRISFLRSLSCETPFWVNSKERGSKAIITICPFSLCESKPIDHESRTKERLLCLYHYLNRWSLTVLPFVFRQRRDLTHGKSILLLSLIRSHHQVFLERESQVRGTFHLTRSLWSLILPRKHSTQQTNVGPFWSCLPCLPDDDDDDFLSFLSIAAFLSL